MANLCIIPARGGSKRIAGKNIKDFHGKPMIYYPIINALKSGIFDEVMVSTDSEEIASVAKTYGASVPFIRSASTSNDFATTAEVLLEVLEQYRSSGSDFENVCCLYPCTPLLSPENLIEGKNKLESENLDSVFSITRFDFPIQRALKISKNQIKFLDEEHVLTRSQDLIDYYHDAGQFYWLNTEAFLKNKAIMQKKTGFVLLDNMDCQDIDNLSDWKLAECKYKMKHTF